MKGSQPSGNTTTTQINPTQQLQAPYLSQGWNGASNLYGSNPLSYYPGQTLASYDPNVAGGYNYAATQSVPNMNDVASAGDNAFNNAVYGKYGVSNSPAYGALGGLINGNLSNPGVSSLANFANGAYTNTNPATSSLQGLISGNLNNPGISNLAATANGSYLNSNPYLNGMFNAASQAVTNQYQTATAPQTDSAMEMAGRYGSGALANAQGQNELNLGTTLGNLASNIYGTNYANERNLQNQASSTLGGLSSGAAGTLGSNYLNALGLQGQAAGQLGGLANSAAGTLQSGYQAGNQAALQGLLLEPQVQQGYLAGPTAQTAAGQGLTNEAQTQINDLISRYYGTEQAPWQTLSQYLSAVGQPTSGSSSVTQPYFQNGAANALGTGLGALGLYNGLNSATGGAIGSGIGSLFGGGGIGATTVPGLLSSGTALASGGADTAATLGSFAPLIFGL